MAFRKEILEFPKYRWDIREDIKAFEIKGVKR